MLFPTILALAAYATPLVAGDFGWQYCNKGTYGNGDCEKHGAWTYCCGHKKIDAFTIPRWTTVLSATTQGIHTCTDFTNRYSGGNIMCALDKPPRGAPRAPNGEDLPIFAPTMQTGSGGYID
ncbi:hypothetical protein E4U53_001097 [Claviceps sorghi]|nr:hypothetical protein E4U53_001097 [Claviceps sorghi]